MLRNRLFMEWGGLALLATLAVVLAVHFRITERFDRVLYDAVSPFHAAPLDDRILLVAIDNDSLARIGPWPWPRAVHGRLLDRLSAGGAKAVAYDVLFIEPAADDAALARALDTALPTVLPVLFQVPGLNGAEADVILPVPALASAASGLGAVNLRFDGDGVVRAAQLATRAGGKTHVHLMEQLYRVDRGQTSPAFKRTAAGEDDSILLPFTAPGSVRTVSFAALQAGEVPADFLRGKLVLVGATADGMGDRYAVPGAAGALPGVEIQANLLSSLLADRLIVPAPAWAVMLASLVPLWMLLAGFLKLRPRHNLMASLALIGAVLGASLLSLAFGGLWVPPGAALLVLLLVYPLWGWRRLETLNAFVGQQTRQISSDAVGDTSTRADEGGLDRIASDAARLTHVIGDLRSMRRFMADIIAGFPDAIFVTDRDGKVTLANPAAHAVIPGGLDGVPVSELLARLAPEAEPGAEDLDLADGRAFLVRRVDLNTDARQLGGQIIRLADVSAMRAAERDREELLQFLSHDMRAPQAAIITLADQEQAIATDKTIWRRIKGFARHTLDLADDFVQLARLRTLELGDDCVDLGNVLDEAVDLAFPIAKRKGTIIASSQPDEEVLVRGDASALTRALGNLIDNAVKYCPDGSRIACALVAEDNRVLCTISDNGPGLPLERREKLFVRFGARGTASAGGAGLGLAFVKGVIDHHGGTIAAEENLGGGTVFVIRLPMAGLVG